MRAGDWQYVSQTDANRSTRDWLRSSHLQLEPLLPAACSSSLLTEDLVGDDGLPINVSEHFGLSGRNLRKILGNFRGILHTAQAAGGGPYIETPAPQWPGFVDVNIPVDRGIELSARLGIAKNSGGPRDAPCIVLLPGIFGDNGIIRTRDLAAALVQNGFHALALELRGHGQTEFHYPDKPYTFGAVETVDLLIVSQWLDQLPYVTSTGLVGFCWGANLALLAAWYDGKDADDPCVTRELSRGLQSVSGRHYTAGVIAFSTIWEFEEMMDELEFPVSSWRDPVLAAVQDCVRTRCLRKQYPLVTHSIRTLIEYEYARSHWHYPDAVADGLLFLRLMPHAGMPAGDKLEYARVPVLVVHAANDPLCPAQDTANMMASVENPKVAAVILPGAGHVGFAPYCRKYYYSMIMNFFDPHLGPARDGRCPPSSQTHESAND